MPFPRPSCVVVLAFSSAIGAWAATWTYADNFDDPYPIDYSKSTGTASWSSTPWAEAGDDGSPIGGRIQVVSEELQFRGQDYTDEYLMTRAANLAGATSATLSFSRRTAGGVDAFGDRRDRLIVSVAFVQL